MTEQYKYDLNRGTILKSPRFNKFTLKNSTVPRALKVAMIDYVKNIQENYKNGVGLYFHSSTPGSGKTTMMSIVLKELMSKGYRVYCDSFIEIKNSLKSEFKSDNPQILNILKEKDILAIDDIGSETMSSWLDEVFKEVLDYRYNMLKPTFFTSNLELGALPFAAKSRDRLKEISIVLKFPENSLRKALDTIK